MSGLEIFRGQHIEVSQCPAPNKSDEDAGEH